MNESPDQKHDAFMRLYVAHEQSVRGFVRSLVPTLDDAQEVMQEVASVLWRRFETLSSHEDFRRWAFGVARLEALEFARKSRRDRHVFGEDALRLLSVEAEAAADDFTAEKSALEVCLEKLEQEQRLLVEAAYAPGARMDQLAAKLGRSAMAVYKTIHRIRIRLSECTKAELNSTGLI